MQPAEYRFSDRDVREDPDLAQLAFQFARNYGGDFDFLVHAHTYAVEHGSLHTSMARGVLNCMRSDIQGLALLQERIIPRRARGLYIVEKPPRPAYINLPTTWHYDYVMSTWPSAEVVHVLNRDASHVRWFPHTGEFKFQLWACKPLYAHHYAFCHEIPADRRLCRACERRMT
jgi:hypothetical protein